MTESDQHQVPNSEEFGQVLRVMRNRMWVNALYDLDRVDLRTHVILQGLNIIDPPVEPPIGADIDLGMLGDPGDPRREPLPPGPILIYLTDDDPPKRMLVEVPVLLLSELPEVRKTAYRCLHRALEEGTLELTPRTVGALQTTREALFSEEKPEWRAAAVTLTDALCDDFFVALQGARQCMQSVPIIKDSLNQYAQRVIRPTVSSIDSIELTVRSPEKEHPRLSEIVAASVSEARTLQDACDRYFDQLGHLPLAPAYSMSEVVSTWVASHPEADTWAEVWKWADEAFGPLPRYHACFVFIIHPELVPEGKLPDLWREILYVVPGPGKKGDENAGLEPWALRSDLARHFSHHFEALLPENDGDTIANFAWWISGRTASLFPDEPTSAQFYRKNWVAPEAGISTQVWGTASSRITMSFLRYVTLAISAPWATALLSSMGNNLQKLAPTEQPPEQQAKFHDALVYYVLGALPMVMESPEDPTYAFECSLGLTVAAWAALQGESSRKDLEQLLETSRTLGSVEGLCGALRKLNETSFPDQVVVGIALKAKALTDPGIAPGVWEILSDLKWRQEVLDSIEDGILGLLLESFCHLQITTQGKWHYELPHYIAEQCERTENDDRRKILFLYVIHTSLASDTTSAVRRLIRGSQKVKFSQFAKEYRDRVEAEWSHYPSWVQGRLRGLLASIRIA